MNFEKLNKGQSPFKFQLPKDSSYKKLKDLEVGTQYQIMGLFVNKSKDDEYDDHPVAVGRHFYIDLPSYANDAVQEILSDDEAIEAINAGQCGIEVTSYTIESGKKKGSYHGFKWINFEVPESFTN